MHPIWDSMPELIITSPYVHSTVDFNTFTMGIEQPSQIRPKPYARVDFIPLSGTLDLAFDNHSFILFNKTPSRRGQVKFPTPGVEPGPAGWKPAILTVRPRGIINDLIRF